jgi:hypothetical protein
MHMKNNSSGDIMSVLQAIMLERATTWRRILFLQLEVVRRDIMRLTPNITLLEEL